MWTPAATPLEIASRRSLSPANRRRQTRRTGPAFGVEAIGSVSIGATVSPSKA